MFVEQVKGCVLVNWFEVLPAEAVALGEALAAKASEERGLEKVIFPAQENIFRALALCPPEKVKVCIVGHVILGWVGMSMLVAL